MNSKKETYKTLGKPASGVIVEKKSIFTGVGRHIKSADEASAFLLDIRKEFPQARHVAYAYIIGMDGNTFRMSDAGEPSGTAGKPILEMLKLHKLVNCAVAVARDFGGILLGTGGLARVYGAACKAAIDACGVCVMEKTARVSLSVPYSLWDIVRHRLSGEPCEIIEVVYMENLGVILRVRECDEQRLFILLNEISSGRIIPQNISADFEPWISN